ncbi:MAG TPA: hypothetical protein VGL53_15995 [Bryobacteraceae bacterium]|jgi:hypothetical protein
MSKLTPILLLAVLLGTASLQAEEKWTFVRSGPFEVWTDGNETKARIRLVEAEQFRYELGVILGKDDLKSVWPIRLLATKDRKRGAGGKLHRVRDLWVITIPLDEPLSAEFRRDATKIFLDSNVRAFPKEIDQALADLLAPLEVNGTKLHLGFPDAASRNMAWARVHLFVTDPQFSGRSRVFFSNLDSGADTAVADRNAFEKSPAEIDKLVAAHLKLGDWPVADLSGRAMSERDFSLHIAHKEEAALARADIGEGSYKEVDSADALESAGDPIKAVEAGSKSATAWFAAAMASKDPVKSRQLLIKSAELNPLWGAPHAALAKLDAGTPARACIEWNKAAQLDLRNVAYWQSAAEAYMAANQFKEAGKAWTGAQRASADPAERDRLHAARVAMEEQSSEFSDSERKRIRDDRARDLERVRNDNLMSIREAEAKANKQLDDGKAPIDAGKVVDWWDGPGGPKQNVTGMLQRVDCLKGPSRLVIKSESGKSILLLVKDPAQVAILNSKTQTLGCGAQTPARHVAVEYQPAVDPKTSTAGAVLTIDFK